MYKVMIVDDEYYVRMDIRTMIDWEKRGFQLTEDAVDGNDALDKIGEYKPDIVLLDIGMPGMNGITLMSRLKETAFPGKIMILSCHDEFDYVKDALLLGAQDYLIKHKLEPEILENALSGLIVKLEGERQQNEQLIKWKAIAAQSLQMQRSRFFQQLLRGYMTNPKVIAESVEQLELYFSIKHSVVMIVKFHDHNGGKPQPGNRSSEQLKARIADEINLEIVNASTGYCYAADNEEILLLLGFESVPSFLYLQNLLHDLSNRVLSLIQQRFGLGASVGVSNHCSSVAHISDYYRQAQASIAGVYFFGKNRIIHYSEVSDYTRKPIRGFKEFEETLLLALTDAARITEVITEMYREIAEQRVSLEEAHTFNFEFISFIKKQQRDHGIAEQDLFESGHSPYEAVNLLETAEEVKGYLVGVMLRLSELLLTSSRGKYRPEIAKAISYMRDNYAGNLSLEIVASVVNKNSAYFSDLFKRETDENFVVFLQKIRIEKAKTLLRTTHDKVYDIASQVGIDNYHYFCKIFKQLTGMTPIQYRTKKMQ
ncbi:response regulator [Cohnella silvisoli]|uniref:Response regulator n=1 Tax=Cohnella silvisoli TaxID=2873699 RepID=A0ABV1KRN2_9BACL|nr:response regulator [Cohnella silvisoli]MCD9021685.1 response regulator [Cohnella silvisoli]